MTRLESLKTGLQQAFGDDLAPTEQFGELTLVVPASRVLEVMQRLRAAGLAHVPVVAGGIIPADDINVLKQLGVAAVYTPKDFDLNRIVNDLVGQIENTADDRII